MRFTSIIAALAVTAIASPAFADHTMVQFGAAYGSEIKTPGGHVGVYYGFRNEGDAEFTTFRFGLEADAFFPKSLDRVDGSTKLTWWDLNGNGHWLFFEPDEVPIATYILLGLNVARVSRSFEYDGGVPPRDEDTSAWKIGGNVGAGVEYRFGAVAVFLEGKYVISSAEQAVGFAGLRITLPKKNRVDGL